MTGQYIEQGVIRRRMDLHFALRSLQSMYTSAQFAIVPNRLGALRHNWHAILMPDTIFESMNRVLSRYLRLHCC